MASACLPSSSEKTRPWINVLRAVQEQERLTCALTYHFKCDVSDHYLLL